MSSYIVCVNSNLEMFIFLVNKFCGELWLPCAACGRVTVGAVNTLLTLTSKELESLNLNKTRPGVQQCQAQGLVFCP